MATWRAEHGLAIALWLLLVAAAAPVYAAGASVESATAEQKATAQKQYGEALEHYEAERYDEALKGFRASYATVESPNSRLMAAQCLARLGKNAEAYQEFEETAKQAERLAASKAEYAETATSAREQQNELKPKLGFVKVKTEGAPAGSSVTVNGRPVATGADTVVEPGSTRVVLTSPEGETAQSTVTVDPGETEEVALTIKRDPPPFLRRPGQHPAYFVELEAHLAFTAFDPPGEARPGAGPGARVSLDLLDNGPIATLNNTLGVSAGVDYIAVGGGSHVFIPVLVQYNLWLAERVGVFIEPGIGIIVRDGTFVRPAAYGGMRYMLSDGFALTARLGWPGFTVGASLLL
jgi:hypothetical protein